MSLRTRNIVVVLASAGMLGLACADFTHDYSPIEGPSIIVVPVTRDDAGPKPEPDLCACAMALHDPGCHACNDKIVQPGDTCDSQETQCNGSIACVADSNCIGGCFSVGSGGAGGGALSAVDCMHGCLQIAGDKYLAYLGCVCKNCDEACTSSFTCPSP